MLDPSIIAGVRAPNFGELADNFGQGVQLRDLMQQSQTRRMQADEQRRQLNADGTLRSLYSSNDPSTPQGQQAIIQGLRGNGLGDVAAQKQGEFAAAAMAGKKSERDDKAFNLKYDSDFAELQKKNEEAKNGLIATGANHALSLPPEQRQAYWQSLKNRAATQFHYDVSDMPDAPPDDASLMKLSRLTMKPEDRAKLEYEEGGRNQWATLKPQLDALAGQVLSKKGGITQGDYSNLMSRINKAIPPQVAALPEYKEWSSSIEKAKPNPPAIQMAGMPNSRALPAYLADWRAVKKNYENIAAPYIAIQGLKNSGSWGTGAGDQSLIDKMIIMETGKTPTVAQYREMSNNYGVSDILDRFTGKIKSGARLPEAVRQQLLSEAEEQIKQAHEGYETSAQEQIDKMKAEGLKPETVVNMGGSYSQVKKALEKKAAPAGGVTTVKTKAERDALPPGTQYMGPDGHIAVKK